MAKFYNEFKPTTKEDKDKKTFDSVNALYEGQQLTRNAFKSGIFPIKATQGKGRPSDLATQLKMLTPKEILQILPITLAQVKAGNTSENLINEIRKPMHSLYR